ncbi:hypothetical protein ABZ345_11815 [Lentzea sp. NPDC005914]|uniref:hypothetical protein n=1 Tax=Lentzea sp. NPDC005914 TaxID=3154572 RepID=UPI003410DE47
MNRRYEYYAMLTEIRPELDDPAGVVRRWTDEAGQTHDERYSRRLVWEPTGDLAMVENGYQGAWARPISAEAVTAFEAIQHTRVHANDPVDGRFSYFAQVDEDHPLDNPKAVVRTWTAPNGSDKEQTHTPGPGHGWETSYLRDDMFHGRDRGELVPISEEAALRYIEAAD